MKEEQTLWFCIHEAVHKTTDILWPPDIWVWIRLMILTLFIGGTLLSSLDLNVIPVGEFSWSDTVISTIHHEVTPSTVDHFIITGILITFFLVCVLFIKSVCSYVFVDVTQHKGLTIGSRFVVRIKNGSQFFLMYLVILGLVPLILIVIALMVLIPVIGTEEIGAMQLTDALVLYLVLSLVCLFPVWVILIIMYDFIIPLMILDTNPIYRAWISFLSLFWTNKTKVLQYLGIRISTTLFIAGIIGFFSFYISYLFVSLPTTLSGGSFWYALCNSGLIAIISLCLMTIFTTFFRFFSLYFLFSLNPRYADIYKTRYPL